MTTLQQQARALGDPTRHRIFRYIADSDRPADVTEMTAHFGLNHNAIRQHLAKLVDAGLVVEIHRRDQGSWPTAARVLRRPGGRWTVGRDQPVRTAQCVAHRDDPRRREPRGGRCPSRPTPPGRRLDRRACASRGSRRRWPGKDSIPNCGIAEDAPRSCCGTARSNPPPSPIRTQSVRCTSASPAVSPRAPRSWSRT